MAIAEVKSVINSCFINGSSAYVGQTIDYGDVIETYNIDIGLEESFKSKLIENDGILTIEFLAEKPKKPEQMRIKSHSKVIFKPGGAWAGANTVLLDSNFSNLWINTLFFPDMGWPCSLSKSFNSPTVRPSNSEAMWYV